MIGPLFGSSRSGSSLPGSVDYAFIVAKNKLGVDGVNAPITGPTSFGIMVTVPSDTNYPVDIVGGLSLTAADTLSFSDGTNTATWKGELVPGDEILVSINLDPGQTVGIGSTMRIGGVTPGLRMATYSTEGATLGANTMNLGGSAIITNYGGSAGAYNTTTHRLSNTVVGTPGGDLKIAVPSGTLTAGKTYRIEVIVSDSTPIHYLTAATNTTLQLHRDGNRFFGEVAIASTFYYLHFLCRGTMLFDIEIISASVQEVTPALVSSAVEYPRVSCWGDSLTYGADGMTPSKGYPWLMQYLLGCDVYNGGISNEISTQIKTRMVSATSKHGDISIIWAGRNNKDFPAVIKADIAEMVAKLTTDKYLVLSVLNASTDSTGVRDTILALNADLAAIYGDNYLDVRALLVDSYDPDLTQDALDYAANVPPDSLRSDTVHLNRSGYVVIYNAIIQKLATLGVAFSARSAPSMFGEYVPFDGTIPAWE